MDSITFKTFEERDSEFEKLQERIADGESVSVDEIRKIEEAKVEEALPEQEPESDGLEDFIPEHAPEGSKPEETKPDLKPGEKPAEKPAEESRRNWTIKEEDIPQEGYYDTKAGKYRPFITQKDPKELFKSYINAQKHIHKLESQVLPEEREKSAAETRDQYEKEIRELQGKIQTFEEAAKKAHESPAPEAKDAKADLAKVLDELKAVDTNSDNYDILDHNKKLQGALFSLAQHVAETGAPKKEPERREAQPQLPPGPVVEQPRKEDGASKAEQWRKACSLIDSFVQNTEDPTLKISKPFFQLTQEMEGFNDALTEAYSGKKARDVPLQEWAKLRERAMGAYLVGEDEIIRRSAQLGVKEPQDYRAWLKLDQIDALRNGLYRDMTGAWAFLKDEATGKAVNLGDMDTAYSKYLDMTGERQRRNSASRSKSARSMADAIARRDAGVVSIDTNALSDIGEGQSLTEEDASSILDAVDTEEVIKESMHGNNKGLERVNQALKRLGREPLEVISFRR